MKELKVGDILWQFLGIEQDGVYEYKVVPKCIESIDDHKVIFTDGLGGSLNNIGKRWFHSRQEALDYFQKKFEGLSSNTSMQTVLEQEQIKHRERTDFQDYQVVKFDTINETSVYTGSLRNLVNITDKLHWHSEPCEPLYMNIEFLTLSEIWEQAKDLSEQRILTVFVDSPLRGTIFQCGNYEEGKWVKYGTTQGYA